MKGTVVNGGRSAATPPRAAMAGAPGTGSFRERRVEGLGHQELLDVYRCMVRSRRLDDKEIRLRNQSRIFFQISGAGHEAIMVAAGLVLKPGHAWVHASYRDPALALQLGVPPPEMLLSAVGAQADPSNGGRQMPSHWGHRALNIISGSSAPTTQLMQAVGSAEAGMIYERVADIPDRLSRFHSDEIVYTSLGEGSTSEGE